MLDWQTFWAMLMTSMVLTLVYCSMKNNVTKMSDNVVVCILLFIAISAGINDMNKNFGNAGINPALASAYIALEVSQLNAVEDPDIKDSMANHYLWAYMLAPLVGGAIGGFISIIHQKCVGNKGDGDVSVASVNQ